MVAYWRTKVQYFWIKELKNKFLQRIDRPGVKRYSSNMVWLTMIRVVQFIAGISVGIYVARQLGPAQYGLFNYALSFAWLFSILGDLGLNSIVVRELVFHPDDSDRLLGTTFILKLGSYFGMMVFALGILFMFFRNTQVFLLILIITCSFIFNSILIIEFYFQARLLNKYVAISRIIAFLITYALRVYCAWSYAPLWCFATIEVITTVVTAIGFWGSYFSIGGRILRWRFDRKWAVFLLRESFPLLLVGASSIIYARIDQVMVTGLISEAANGQYAVAVRAVEFLISIVVVFESTFFPVMLECRAVSLLRYYQRTIKMMRVMFYIILVSLVPLAISGYWAIRILYGDEYQTGAMLYAIFTLKMLLVYPGAICGRWYLAEGLQNLSLWISVCGAVSNIILNYALIKVFGVTGAVYATLISNFGVLFIFPLPFRKGRFGVRLLLEAIIPFIPAWHRTRLSPSE